MIYLIGGSPRGGKSILSRKLSRKMNIPYISTDNIRPIVMPYFKGRERHKKFPFEKMFVPAHIDNYFKKYTGHEIINADLVEAKTLWPGVKRLVSYLLACRADYIIEGVHLLPNLVRQFKSSRRVKIIFLAKLDEEKIYEGIFKNKNHNDWILDNVRDKKTIRLAAGSIAAYGDYFIGETKKYGFKLINTETNFARRLNEAMDYLRG